MSYSLEQAVAATIQSSVAASPVSAPPTNVELEKSMGPPIQRKGPEICEDGVARFWCCKDDSTFLITKGPKDSTAHLCVRLNDTRNCHEVNRTEPDFCFHLWTNEGLAVDMPSLQDCLGIVAVFMDWNRVNFENLAETSDRCVTLDMPMTFVKAENRPGT